MTRPSAARPTLPTSAGGTSYTFRESYLMGWLLYYCTKGAIILSDRRVLLLQIHGGDRPGVLRSQVRYDERFLRRRRFVELEEESERGRRDTGEVFVFSVYAN